MLSNKALTWDVLCGKGREGSGRWYLCKEDGESNLHLGVEHPYTKSVSREIEAKLQINNLWMGN